MQLTCVKKSTFFGKNHDTARCLLSCAVSRINNKLFAFCARYPYFEVL